MCDSCGCHISADAQDDASSKIFDIHKSLLATNNSLAEKNKEHFDQMSAIAINLISSPGSGKTTLLEKTITKLGNKLKIAVIEGDIETDLDAERIRAQGVPVVQITTGGACHLDANLVHKGIHQLQQEFNIDKLDILFIENVGNLVCPAAFNLGEHKRVVMVSVPEGSDKPAKYPTAFAGSDLFMITKIDLLQYFNFSTEDAIKEALLINPMLDTLSISSTTEEGIDQWISYLLSLKRT